MIAKVQKNVTLKLTAEERKAIDVLTRDDICRFISCDDCPFFEEHHIGCLLQEIGERAKELNVQGGADNADR